MARPSRGQRGTANDSDHLQRSPPSDAASNLSLVERVPMPLRILYSIKLGFLYRLNKQINERFIYEKVNVHIYYSLETDVPALQGAHTAACSVPMHHIVHQYTHMPMDSAQ